MAKVIFTISYEINPEKREEYLSLSRKTKSHFVESKGKNYAIYEQKGKRNTFSEVFICNSREEYDQLEDDEDKTLEEFIQQLDAYLINGKMKYTTLIEID